MILYFVISLTEPISVWSLELIPLQRHVGTKAARTYLGRRLLEHLVPPVSTILFLFKPLFIKVNSRLCEFILFNFRTDVTEMNGG